MSDLDETVVNSSCGACDKEDNDEMVQCDKCDVWYHFTCVGVTNAVSKVAWSCVKCRPKPSSSGHRSQRGSMSSKTVKSAAKKHPQSHSSSSSKKRAEIALQILEEKKQLAAKRAEEQAAADAAYLEEKKKLLEDAITDDDDDSSEGNDLGVNDSAENKNRTAEWVHNQSKFDQPGTSAAVSVPPAQANMFEPSQVPPHINVVTNNPLRHVEFSSPQAQFAFYTPANSTFGPQNGGEQQVNNLPPQSVLPPTNSAGYGGLNSGQMGGQTAYSVPPVISGHQYAARHATPKELPTFSGKPEEWPLFISSFENTTNVCGFTNAENLIRLQRSLKGKALEAVSCRLLIPSSVPDVIKTLKFLFGRPEQIINNLLEKIRREPLPKAENLQSIINFALSVQNLCGIMEAAGLTFHLNNPMLLQELVSRLPAQIAMNWGMYSMMTPNSNMSHFSSWLYRMAEAASTVSLGISTSVNETHSEKRQPKAKEHLNAHVVHFDVDDIVKKMEKLGRRERWDMLKQQNLCRKCLGKHHPNRCKQSTVCGKDGCEMKHHRLLHNEEYHSKPGDTNKKPSQSDTKDGQHCNAHQQSSPNRILFRIVPVSLYGKTKKVDTFAFLDEGSSITMLEESVATELELDGTPERLCLKWTADTTRDEPDSKRVSVTIASRTTGSNRYQLHDVRTVSSLNLPVQTIETTEMIEKYPHLRNVAFENYDNAIPQILIGIDNWKLCTPSDVREGKWKEPVASKTRLGWTVYGQYHHREDDSQPILHHNFHICSCNKDNALHSMVKEFFSLENFGVRPTESTIESHEQKRAKIIMEATTVRNGNRYETGLLWRYDQVKLPDSFPMAKRRLTCLERKMARDPDLRENLNGQMKDYVKKGYARKLTEVERREKSPRTWYLPIFAVKNPNKPGKIRMVWDAAAKVDGMSLNSVLLKGPDQLASLPHILYGFRQKSVAICADIREMFHQVRVRQADQHSQRFLWQSEAGQLEVYAMQVMTFGATCSPSSAHYVKDQNALRFLDKYPRAVDAIRNHHYVDDLLDSVDTTEEAIQLAKEVYYIHQQGGFEIRHWISNSSAVAKAMDEEESPGMKDINVSAETTTEKVLGMWWCTKTDTFTYTIRISSLNHQVLIGKRRPTKREILRTLMSVFDPLGFLAAFLVYIKILLQEIWRSGVGWDDAVEDVHYEKWLTWIDVLPKIEDIRIPRCYRSNALSGGSTELHIFVDASENAYAAVAYFRTFDKEQIECSLIGAKTKVAPQQPISIPRLELQAAVLGTRLAATVESGHSVSIKRRIFWSDSKTVLCWLRADPKRFRQFVSLRIGEILETTDLAEWRWIPTKENVADDATKWQPVPAIGPQNRWFSGPKFLLLPESSWPNDKPDHAETSIANSCELRPLHLHTKSFAISSPCTADADRFDSWYRLLRSQAVVYRAIDTFKKMVQRLPTPFGPITSEEMLKAEYSLFRKSQVDNFASEIAILQQNAAKPPENQLKVPRSSVLAALSLYIDDNSLLRVDGRTDAAENVGDDAKNPIILPRDHRITVLVVQSFHRRYHHHNHETVINEIRQRFYITRIRQMLKSVRARCQRCKNARSRPQPPRMADLPPARLSTYTRPFTFVGIDYFGPMIATVGRRSEKRWGVLITCLTVRAVHLEVAHTLNTDSCIMCIRNFIARRGTPREIYCDNGTNLHGADNELQKSLKDVNFSNIQERFESSTTKWYFNPPASPHMGGSWERLVGSVKKILIEIMPTRNPNDEILRTVLMEAENIVNSRPLTHVSIEPGDEEALTPNHFLIGSSNGSKPLGTFTDADLILRKNWRKTQLLADNFWKRWLREYLPTITRRGKWFQRVKPIEVNDIVVIADDKLPRNCWPMGRVISTNPGRDGQVRSATVQTKTGILNRPAVKLAVLDVRNG